VDRAFGILWIASAIVAGFVHYRAKHKLFAAVVAACFALAIQFGIAFVLMALIYAGNGGSILVTSRETFINSWMGISLAASVVAFWALIWRRVAARQ
jgi:hypothetical protein